MLHDRRVTISVGASRTSTNWQPQSLLLSELYARLAAPVCGTESLTEYLSLPKTQQDNLKDVGGFVAGTLSGSRRKADTVTGREIITLDLDTIPPYKAQEVCATVDALGCGYCIYSTRKHRPEAPRLRILLPLDRVCSADEYEPCARYIASLIGIQMADPTTFEASRLMFWPSCSADGEYIYLWADRFPLSVEGLLNQYVDWRDISEWPTVPGETPLPRLAARQEDPTAKAGIVGAFCRCYDVPAAMDAFLPGVYAASGTGRYTFLGGSTTNGAVLYEDGKFLFSHHATDPCSGKLVNAFDLVRIHRFGHLDTETTAATPGHKLPSFKAMLDFAAEQPAVKELLVQERWERVQEAFDGLSGGAVESPGADVPDRDTGATGGSDAAWMQGLEVGKNGKFVLSLQALSQVMKREPHLHGCARVNLFSGRLDAMPDLPWARAYNGGAWTDDDEAHLKQFLEPVFGKVSTNDLQDALRIVSSDQAYHPVRDYLLGLAWDGVPRLDTLFIDYLGAEDTAYTRAVTRKAFTAAVARIMRPGCKYDTMPVLIGGQGRHKSTILAKMGGAWFSDSLRSFGDKDSMETIQGTWLNEIAEMQAMSASGMNAVKMFLTKTEDYFRASYGRYPRDYPRQCVFFGTTNTRECLEDTTGNRRWWPIDIDVQPRTKGVFTDLDAERDQLWAEAVMRFNTGETLHLDAELERVAMQVQEDHRSAHPWEGMIEAFLDEPVPVDWRSMDAKQRAAWYSGGFAEDVQLAPRDRVCIAEIWRECLGGQKDKITKTNRNDIAEILRRMPGWTFGGVLRAGVLYGRQKCYCRES